MPNKDKEGMDESGDEDDSTAPSNTHSPSQPPPPPPSLPIHHDSESTETTETEHINQSKARYGPSKNSKMVQFPLKWKLKLFKALENEHISDEQLLSDDVNVKKHSQCVVMFTFSFKDYRNQQLF